ncbi:hypothetical protein CSA37_00490 [Candidatus Fermentibacteria bacterium]|nr:MAG: hypothetical protein CSA37_00490 [Candidatus Fermentibacteria bacterium]
MRKRLTALILFAILAVSCSSPAGESLPEGFNRQISVFGVRIWATPSVSETTLLRAGMVLAQYLDNDEDGKADNSLVAAELASKNATIMMFATQSEAEAFDFDKLPSDIQAAQDLYSSETNPEFDPDGENSFFDASLEEVLHIITSCGYAGAYPEVFGLQHGSTLSVAMDTARGGYFPQIPELYPQNAWYTYYDRTCMYECQITEYIYWTITSSLGAQDYSGRYQEISDEWRLNTPELLRATDTRVTEIIDNPEYKLPAVLPDNTYNGFDITVTEL